MRPKDFGREEGRVCVEIKARKITGEEGGARGFFVKLWN